MLGFVGDVGDLAKVAMAADGHVTCPAATRRSATNSPTVSGASSCWRTCTKSTSSCRVRPSDAGTRRADPRPATRTQDRPLTTRNRHAAVPANAGYPVMVGALAVALRLPLPLADCFANGRPPWSLAHRCGVRCSQPRSCGEGLRSPTWDEVTVSRSGGTTIGCGAPSSGRDAGRNVTRRVRRHRRLCGPSQQSAHRAELRVVAPVAGVACRRRGLSAARPTGGSRGGECSGTWRASDAVVERRRRLVLASWSHARRRATAEHRPHIVSSRPWSHWTMSACGRPVATTNRGRRRRAVWRCASWCTSSAVSPRRVASAASQPVAAAWAAG